MKNRKSKKFRKVCPKMSVRYFSGSKIDEPKKSDKKSDATEKIGQEIGQEIGQPKKRVKKMAFVWFFRSSDFLSDFLSNFFGLAGLLLQKKIGHKFLDNFFGISVTIGGTKLDAVLDEAVGIIWTVRVNLAFRLGGPKKLDWFLSGRFGYMTSIFSKCNPVLRKLLPVPPRTPRTMATQRNAHQWSRWGNGCW